MDYREDLLHYEKIMKTLYGEVEYQLALCRYAQWLDENWYLNETETPVAPVEAPPKEEQKEKLSEFEEAKEDADPKDENGGTKPPEEGKCKRCGLPRKLNRLRLCYPCFVIWNIQDIEKKAGREWNPGDPHPSWCDCEGLGEHRYEDGSSRGFN